MTRLSIEDVLFDGWDGVDNNIPLEWVIDALAAAAEDGPIMDAERGIAVIAYDPDELHQVELTDDGWTVLHPMRERLDGSLFDCEADWSAGDIGVRGRYWLDIRGRLGDLIDGGES